MPRVKALSTIMDVNYKAIKRMRVYVLAVAVELLLAVWLVACGGGNQEATTTSQQLPAPRTFDEGSCQGWGGMGAVREVDSHCRFEIDPHCSLDWNHAPLMGALYLVSYVSTGPIYSPTLGLDDYDLTGAVVKVWMRGVDFEPNGAELVFWIASQSDLSVLNKIGPDGIPLWRRSNYALTGFPLTSLATDGHWHLVQIPLAPEPYLWECAGNNPAQGAVAVRYDCRGIEDTLRNVNVDIMFNLIGVDESNRPTGFIDFHFDSAELIYPD